MAPGGQAWNGVPAFHIACSTTPSLRASATAARLNPRRWTSLRPHVFSADGRFNINTSGHRRRFEPIDPACDCYTCGHYTAAYLHHLFKAGESLAGTLATIHNQRFLVRLVDRMRQAIGDGDFTEFRADFLGRYYAGTATGSA